MIILLILTQDLTDWPRSRIFTSYKINLYNFKIFTYLNTDYMKNTIKPRYNEYEGSPSKTYGFIFKFTIFVKTYQINIKGKATNI